MRSSKVECQIGGLLSRSACAAKLFDVKMTTADNGGVHIEWSKVEAARDWTTRSAGRYVLRTSVADWTDEELWKADIQLTEAKAASRIHESDLSFAQFGNKKRNMFWHTSSCTFLPTSYGEHGVSSVTKPVRAANLAKSFLNSLKSVPWCGVAGTLWRESSTSLHFKAH